MGWGSDKGRDASPRRPQEQPARRASPTRWLASLAFLFSLHAQPVQPPGLPDLPEEEGQLPDFSSEEIRTRPLTLDEPEKGIVVDIEILRWGAREERDQDFTLSVQSQPAFIENLALESDRITLTPEDTSSDLQLSFDIKDDNAASDGERLEGEIVLLISSEDRSLTPNERRFVIPLRFYPETEDDGRSIFVTTIGADYDGQLNAEDIYLHCHPDEVTPLYTIDPIWIFFKGLPKEEKFFYKLIGPDGEEIETYPYDPNDEYGNGVLPAKEGAISPIYKELKELKWGGDAYVPRAAGKYTVMVASQETKFREFLGEYRTLGEFREVGTFELVDPLLHYKGAFVVNEKRKPGHGRLTASGAGNGASVEARWPGYGGDTRERGADGSVSFDYPSQLVWSSQSATVPASYSVSGSTFGQDGDRVEKRVQVSSVGGFIVSNSASALSELNSQGGLSRGRPMNALTPLRGRAPGKTDGKFEFDIRMPTPNYAEGEPKRILGWHLRDPTALFGILHSLNVTPTVIGGIDSAYVYAVYGPEPGGVVAPPSDGRDEEQVAEETPPEDETEEPAAAAEEVAADNDPSRQTDGPPPLPIPSASGPTPASSSGGSRTPPWAESIGSVTSTATGGIDLGLASSGVDPRSQGGTPEQNQQLDEALATDNPDRIPPGHPRVIEVVARWLGLAEPPANADPEVNLRYTEWGTVVGQAKGGTITQNYKPDEAAGQSSTEYLWNYRRDLDSLNHCQLGAWAMAELAGQPLTGCSGRFSAPGMVAVPNVIGQFVDAAERALVSAGLVPVIAIGPPAPTPGEEGVIAKQTPPFGGALRNGGPVEIEMFTNYAPSSALPNLVGLTIDEAEAAILENGYVMDLKLGDPAPSPSDENRIQKQDPSGYASLEQGAAISVWVHSPFVESFTAPSLVGSRIDAARAALDRLGFGVDARAGSVASNPADAGRVYRQDPGPESSVLPGDNIRLWYYSEYANEVTVPNLVGQHANEAELIALELGLVVRRLRGPPAPTPDQASVVISQSPQPGAKVTLLTEIEVTVYDQAVDEPSGPTPATVVASESDPGDTLVVPDTFLGISLWNGTGSAKVMATGRKLNAVQQAATRRPANDWKYALNKSQMIHGATATYGVPDSEGALSFTMLWEEESDARTDEIKCGAPYESDYFFSDSHTMGRITSSSKRATVIFIAPTERAEACRSQLSIYLKQAERFARSCY